MSGGNCKYHPQRLARFQCGKCKTFFCDSCVSRDGMGGRAICPLCRVPLEAVSSDRLIPPFWTRLPSFILFPFKPNILGFIVALLALGYLAAKTVILAGLYPLLAFLVVFKYAYQVMAHRAEGHSDAPSPWMAFTGSISPSLKQLAVFIILSIPAIPLMRYGGELGAGLGALITSAILPAGIMVLITSESVGAAVNPDKLVRTIRTIGAPYFALCGVLFLFSASCSMAQGFIVEHSMGEFGELMEQMQEDPESVDPEALARAQEAYFDRFLTRILPMIAAIQGYQILVSFALMGYVLYQFHSKLELPVAVKPDEEPRDRDEHALLGDVEVLIREGRLENAAGLLRERVVAYPSDMKLRERFHSVLAATGDVRRLTGHGAEYIGLLLRNNSGKAVDVYRACRKADAAFTLDSTAQVLPLARLMFQMGDHAGVVAIANGFHRTAPGHRDIPDLYFLAARSLSEGLGRDGQARPILQSLLKGYPEHPLAAEIGRYLGTLERIASPP